MAEMDYIVTLAHVLPSVAVASIVFICFLHVFLLLRRKLSVKVNCWFCNTWTVVKYENKNSFDCPSCLQYNGFTKDGDYNKVIAEQFEASCDEPKFIKKDLSYSNGLCDACNKMQSLKIQQLANFVPKNEKYFDVEMEEYKKSLDILYKLCSICENVVKKTIHDQNKWLLGLKFIRLRETTNKLKETIANKPKITLIQKSFDALIVLLSCFMLFCVFSQNTKLNLKEIFTLPLDYLKNALGDLKIGNTSLNFIIKETRKNFKYLLVYTTKIFGKNATQSFESNYTALTISYYKTPISEVVDFTLLSILGLLLQITTSFLKFEQRYSLIKLIPWILLIFTSYNNTVWANKDYKTLVEVASSLLIIYLTIFYKGNKRQKHQYKTKKHAFKRIEKPEEILDDSLSDNENLDNSFSTTKSEKQTLNDSFNNLVKPVGLQSPKASLNESKKNTFEDLSQKIRKETAMFGKQPVFGQQAVFTNNLNQSTNSLNSSSLFNEQSFVKPSYFTPILTGNMQNYQSSFSASFSTNHNDTFRNCFSPNNQSFQSSFSCYNNELTSNFGDFDCCDLPKSFSKLQVGSNRNDLKVNLQMATSIPSVFSFKTIQRPKPVLTPPKLLDIHKTWNNLNSLSRSSSQTSGFVSEIFNGSSLPSSRNGSPHKEFDRSSLLSEPAYHMNSFQNNYAPSLNSSFRSFSPI